MNLPHLRAMCGISGIIKKNDSSVDHREIKRQTDLVTHRGPDDEGYYFGNNFALGHRRLAILDLSPAGHQPMSYMDKYVIVYNGEVYNYLELREELLNAGYTFRSRTDTEVILAAYDKWGTACVNRFNGMWAFALFDKEKSILFCSRDRFGIKPFYYLDTASKFVFGSEIKQLLIHLPHKTVNEEVLICYLLTRYQEHTDQTFFQNIRKLQGSHNLVYDLRKHTFRIDRYYQIRFHKDIEALEEEDAVKLYRNEFARSVKFRMRSDVRVGTCLSGGLDSSSVATEASGQSRLGTELKFNAITARSIDPRLDETGFAKMVADRAGLQWHVIEPTTEDFIQAIDDVVFTHEEPFNGPSILMQYFVFQKAREEGCIVMLDGQGGDETLLGYEKYLPAAYLDYCRKEGPSRTLKEILLTRRNNQNMPLSNIAFYGVASFFPYLRKKEHQRRCSFINPKWVNGYLGIIDELGKTSFDVKALQVLEIEKTNLPILLRHEDRNSMRHSVESRLPFLDYQTLETALSIKTSHKIKHGWTKYLLRKAMEDKMPKEVTWRKNKLGFAAPEHVWLSAHLEEMTKCVSQSSILRGVADMPRLLKVYPRLDRKLQWRIFNVAKWERLFDVHLGA